MEATAASSSACATSFSYATRSGIVGVALRGHPCFCLKEFDAVKLSILFLILLLMSAQETASVEIVKASWSKVRIGWERDPFGGPLENFDEMRSRTRNERRVAVGGGERARREAKADAANLAKQREQSPPQYYFIYKTKIKNNYSSAITQIDWDHVFYERGSENEVGRQEFTSDEQIGAGRTKELTVTITSPPTHTVSVNSLNLEERDRLTERIILVRIQYADGRIWQAP